MMWNTNLILLNVVSDGLVALSYYSIPAALFTLTLKKRDAVPMRPLVILFGLFIAFCGAGHVMDIVSIWKPIYWIKGFWNTGTAVTSVVTAIILIPKVAGFLKLPETTAQLEREKDDLQERHGILQTVLSSVSEGILLTDMKGHVLTHNSAAEAILGGQVKMTWNGGNGETVIAGRTVEHSMQAVEGLGLVHVLRDVTEKRKSEETRLRLERVIDTMRQGFAIVARDHDRLDAANPAMEQLFGGPVDGLTAAEIFSGTRDEKTSTLHSIREVADTEGYWEGELLCVRRNGEEFSTWTRVNLHEAASGNFISLLLQDITEQKRMQRETEALQARLAESQKLETLGVLAGGVAHDFNNLLTGIMGNASLALYSDSQEDLQERLKDVVKASERAADLTRQLLAYAGKGQLSKGPVDLTGLAEETVSLVQSVIPKNVGIKFNLKAGLPAVQADAGQIQPILMNLIINASEAIGDGPGLVEVSTSEQLVAETDGERNQLGEPLPAGRYVCVQVRDNGCGMNDETMGRIFDPFYTTKFTGRGLGLSTVAGVVRSHGGNVRVTSSVGNGSTFRILLPASESRMPGTKPDPPVEDLHGTGTVLVVDDQEMVRRTASVTLQHYGYEVLLAEHGKKALEVLHRSSDRVSLVVLDSTMPVMSGAETLREIRKLWPGLPIMLISGFTLAEAQEKFRESGFEGFLQKPFTAQGLAKAVMELKREVGTGL
jgi:PAS domain S-box-containing protein